MTSTIYGQIITGSQVRAAYQDVLTTWLPSYIAEVERQIGVDLPPVRHYSTGIPQGTPPDELPGIIVVAPGINGSIERVAGRYTAPWGVGVGVVVAHPSRDSAGTLAEAYAAALRACILQHGALDGFAEETRWEDEECSEVAWTTEHSTWMASLYFTSVIPGVVDAGGGPRVPPSPDPVAPMQTVEITSTSVITAQP